MKLIFLGAPGAGKGTQAEVLSAKLSIPTISTGNILRAAVSAGTPLGLKVKQFMDSGALVPDDVIIDIVRERLSEPDCANGWILDGMPRTIPQAEALQAAGIVPDAVVSLEVPDELIEKRMTGRRACPKCGATYHIEAKPPVQEGKCDICGAALIIRKDDKPETVKSRLAVYHRETEPLKAFYSALGKVKEVDGPTIEATTAAIFEKLGIQ